MMDRRRNLERRSTLLAAVVILQLLATIFFVSDIAGDLRTEPPDAHLLVELGAVLALLAGVLFGAAQIRWLILRARQDEAAVATAQLNLGFTEVRSPIDGRTGRAMITAGNLAQADATVLTTVVSMDPVYVDFEGDESTWLRYNELARKGERTELRNAVRVGLANEDGYPHRGIVDFVDNRVDAATGTIHARAVLANPDHALTPGLFARVQLEGAAASDAMLVDDKAVLTDQDRKYVYVLGAGDKALRKDIVPGRVVDGLRVVASGLDAQDKVIVAGLQKVFFPGMPVQPRTIAMEEPAPGQPVAMK